MYASWEVKGATIVEKVTGEGSLRFLLDIYENATYANKVVNFPFQSTLNANINMQVLCDCEIVKFATCWFAVLIASYILQLWVWSDMYYLKFEYFKSI